MNVTEIVQGIIDALSLGGIYALTALGIALIFGIMRLVNLAHGELIMLAGYAVFFAANISTPLLLFIGLAVLAAAFAAFAMELIAFRPMRSESPTTLMVTSFGVSYLLQNLAVAVVGSQAKPLGLTGFNGIYQIASFRIAKLDAITIATTFGLLALLAALLRYTSFGLKIRAAAEDFKMARLLGIGANSVIAAAFCISGALAGIVAVLLIARTGNVSPTMGVTPLIVGVVAVVIGGMESLLGAVLGGLILGSLTTALQVLLPLSLRPFRDAVAFTAVIVFLLVRPTGIFGLKVGRV